MGAVNTLSLNPLAPQKISQGIAFTHNVLRLFFIDTYL
jgi:hypothetical protein